MHAQTHLMGNKRPGRVRQSQAQQGVDEAVAHAVWLLDTVPVEAHHELCGRFALCDTVRKARLKRRAVTPQWVAESLACSRAHAYRVLRALRSAGLELASQSVGAARGERAPHSANPRNRLTS